MREVLVATDLSLRSEHALHRAVRLSREFAVPLSVLHVVESDQPTSLAESESQQAAALLHEQLRALTEPQDPPARVLVEQGDTFPTILRIAETSGADLIVMGTHRRRLLHDLVTGTTVERVLHVFHAFAKEKMIHAGVSAGQVQEHVAQCAQEAMAQLTEFVDQLGLEGMRVGRSVEEGEPAAAIRSVVDRERPDLLVIGTHGRTGLPRALLGSVADSLLREIGCDVLAVPPRTS